LRSRERSLISASFLLCRRGFQGASSLPSHSFTFCRYGGIFSTFITPTSRDEPPSFSPFHAAVPSFSGPAETSLPFYGHGFFCPLLGDLGFAPPFSFGIRPNLLFASENFPLLPSRCNVFWISVYAKYGAAFQTHPPLRH